MPKGTFERALALVFELEGGFVQHPRDPGGATNLGITRTTLARARGRPVSVTALKALTRAEAGAIYGRFYWDPIRADELPPGLDLALFDYAVNSGPVQAVRSVQTVLGPVADGRLGPQTLAAAVAADPDDTIRALTRNASAFCEVCRPGRPSAEAGPRGPPGSRPRRSEPPPRSACGRPPSVQLRSIPPFNRGRKACSRPRPYWRAEPCGPM